MTAAVAAGVVVDTMVISSLFDDRHNSVADRYRTLIDATPVLLAFKTVMELRYGALRAGWGSLIRAVRPMIAAVSQGIRLRDRPRRHSWVVIRRSDDMAGICLSCGSYFGCSRLTE